MINLNTKLTYRQALLLALATIVATLIAFLMVDRFAGTPEIITGYVFEKSYAAEVNHTMRKNGQSRDYKQIDADYRITVTNDGNYVSIACEPEYYYAVVLGEEVKYISQRGCITGWYWVKQLIY